MTRFEQIAAAFPLHAQRIAECAYAEDPSTFDEWRHSASTYSAVRELACAFCFSRTTEGARYWWQLSTGERVL